MDNIATNMDCNGGLENTPLNSYDYLDYILENGWSGETGYTPSDQSYATSTETEKCELLNSVLEFLEGDGCTTEIYKPVTVNNSKNVSISSNESNIFGLQHQEMNNSYTQTLEYVPQNTDCTLSNGCDDFNNMGNSLHAQTPFVFENEIQWNNTNRMNDDTMINVYSIDGTNIHNDYVSQYDSNHLQIDKHTYEECLNNENYLDSNPFVNILLNPINLNGNKLISNAEFQNYSPEFERPINTPYEAVQFDTLNIHPNDPNVLLDSTKSRKYNGKRKRATKRPELGISRLKTISNKLQKDFQTLVEGLEKRGIDIRSKKVEELIHVFKALDEAANKRIICNSINRNIAVDKNSSRINHKSNFIDRKNKQIAYEPSELFTSTDCSISEINKLRNGSADYTRDQSVPDNRIDVKLVSNKVPFENSHGQIESIVHKSRESAQPFSNGMQENIEEYEAYNSSYPETLGHEIVFAHLMASENDGKILYEGSKNEIVNTRMYSVDSLPRMDVIKHCDKENITSENVDEVDNENRESRGIQILRMFVECVENNLNSNETMQNKLDNLQVLDKHVNESHYNTKNIEKHDAYEDKNNQKDNDQLSPNVCDQYTILSTVCSPENLPPNLKHLLHNINSKGIAMNDKDFNKIPSQNNINNIFIEQSSATNDVYANLCGNNTIDGAPVEYKNCYNTKMNENSFNSITCLNVSDENVSKSPIENVARNDKENLPKGGNFLSSDITNSLNNQDRFEKRLKTKTSGWKNLRSVKVRNLKKGMENVHLRKRINTSFIRNKLDVISQENGYQQTETYNLNKKGSQRYIVPFKGCRRDNDSNINGISKHSPHSEIDLIFNGKLPSKKTARKRIILPLSDNNLLNSSAEKLPFSLTEAILKNKNGHVINIHYSDGNKPRTELLISLTNDTVILECASFIAPFLLETPLKKIGIFCENRVTNNKESTLTDKDSFDENRDELNQLNGSNEESSSTIKTGVSNHEKPIRDNTASSMYNCSIGEFFIELGLHQVQLYLDKKKISKPFVLADRVNNDATKKFSPNPRIRNKTYRCPFCTFKSESFFVLANHLRTPHFKNSVYHCNFCSFWHGSSTEMIHHTEEKHNITSKIPYTSLSHLCPLCFFETHFPGKLTRHLQFCQKKFNPLTAQTLSSYIELPAIYPKQLCKITKFAKQINPAHFLSGFLPSDVEHQIKLSDKLTHSTSVSTKINRSVNNKTKPAENIALNIDSANICPIPTRTEKTSSQFVVHNNTTNTVASVDRVTSISRSPSPVKLTNNTIKFDTVYIICELCSAYVTDLNSLIQHMALVHKLQLEKKTMFNNSISCKLCPRKFFTTVGLQKHILQSHRHVFESIPQNVSCVNSNLHNSSMICKKLFEKFSLQNSVNMQHVSSKSTCSSSSQRERSLQEKGVPLKITQPHDSRLQENNATHYNFLNSVQRPVDIAKNETKKHVSSSASQIEQSLEEKDASMKITRPQSNTSLQNNVMPHKFVSSAQQPVRMVKNKSKKHSSFKITQLQNRSQKLLTDISLEPCLNTKLKKPLFHDIKTQNTKIIDRKDDSNIFHDLPAYNCGIKSSSLLSEGDISKTIKSPHMFHGFSVDHTNSVSQMKIKSKKTVSFKITQPQNTCISTEQNSLQKPTANSSYMQGHNDRIKKRPGWRKYCCDKCNPNRKYSRVEYLKHVQIKHTVTAPDENIKSLTGEQKVELSLEGIRSPNVEHSQNVNDSCEYDAEKYSCENCSPSRKYSHEEYLQHVEIAHKQTSINAPLDNIHNLLVDNTSLQCSASQTKSNIVPAKTISVKPVSEEQPVVSEEITISSNCDNLSSNLNSEQNAIGRKKRFDLRKYFCKQCNAKRKYFRGEYIRHIQTKHKCWILLNRIDKISKNKRMLSLSGRKSKAKITINNDKSFPLPEANSFDKSETQLSYSLVKSSIKKHVGGKSDAHSKISCFDLQHPPNVIRLKRMRTKN